MELSSKRCKPCEGIGSVLESEKASGLLLQLKGWSLVEGKLQKKFKFKDFQESMDFVNKVASISEKEGHHPDIKINYNRVTLELFTHFLKGMTENDFILAAKIDNLSKE